MWSNIETVPVQCCLLATVFLPLNWCSFQAIKGEGDAEQLEELKKVKEKLEKAEAKSQAAWLKVVR